MKKTAFLLILSMFFNIAVAQPPAGYYNGTTGLTGATLKTQLSQIITNGHSDQGYAGLWTGYLTTDRDYFYENDATVLDIYSENPTGTDPYTFTPVTDQCGNYANEGDCYNREHIVPQSLFSEASPMKNDIHTVRPTDGKVNGMRNNFPFGVVGTASFTSFNGSKLGNSVSPGFSGTVFEPLDAFKGDVARMIFYFVTRYESQLSSFSTGNMLGGSAYPGLQAWQLQQLLLWNAQDPVSTAETARNNASHTFQGNRNPFIDNAQWANDIWGTPDSVPPTAPTNLVTGTPTSSTVPLSWTASTDNVAVIGYDLFVNGVYHSTVTGTSVTVTALTPATTYSFYVVAKDQAGNSSAGSNTVTVTTLAETPGGSCGAENFENIPTTNPSAYATRTWTNNSISWTATDARTDQTINGKAITIRNGSLTSSTVSGGVQSITVTTQLKFGSSAGTFTVRVNGTAVGTAAYSGTTNTSVTTTINNINITGNAVISITDNSITANRVALDDLSWTCFTLGTQEASTVDTLTLYPNPVTDGVLYVRGKDLNKISRAHIFTLEGRLIQSEDFPFLKANKIQLKDLPAGIYLLKLDEKTLKFIIK